MNGTVETTTFRAALSTGLPETLDGLASELRDLEALKATIEARQARLALQVDRQVRDRAAHRGEPTTRQGRGAAEIIATARRITPTQGRIVLATAKRVAAMPGINRLWADGVLNEQRVTTIVRETADLDPPDIAELDARLAATPDLGGLAVKKIAHTTRAIATTLDPTTVEARRAHAIQDRHVTIRPTDRGDGMGWLHALLPIEQAYAIKVTLDAAADTSIAAGVATSRGQVRADTLIARITGSDVLGLDHPVHGVKLNLIMTDTSLLGRTSEPAWLAGMGPIPATLATDLVRRAAADTTLRRLYAHPTSGQLVTMESKTRRFPAALTEFIRLRDQLCATPNCGASIAHIDHITDWATGGPTTATNGQGLCRQCNWAKQNPDVDPDTGSPPPLRLTQVETYPTRHELALANNYARAA